MYEALYEPLPNCAAYAERIGMPWPLTPDLATLDQIIFRHQCEIPFENLEAYARKQTPSLEIAALYQKVVEQHRGGYCFELNALLCAFLQGVGYDAWSVSCRILRGKDFIPPMLHRGLVHIQNQIKEPLHLLLIERQLLRQTAQLLQHLLVLCTAAVVVDPHSGKPVVPAHI